MLETTVIALNAEPILSGANCAIRDGGTRCGDGGGESCKNELTDRTGGFSKGAGGGDPIMIGFRFGKSVRSVAVFAGTGRGTSAAGLIGRSDGLVERDEEGGTGLPGIGVELDTIGRFADGPPTDNVRVTIHCLGND